MGPFNRFTHYATGYPTFGSFNDGTVFIPDELKRLQEISDATRQVCAIDVQVEAADALGRAVVPEGQHDPSAKAAFLRLC